MPSRVTCVVVTYNRKDDLKRCLQALCRQKYPISEIIVVDNASTDATASFLTGEAQGYPIPISHLRLRENAGGAGGFHAGTKAAFESGCDFAWLMDDDGHPENTETLAHMMDAADSLSIENDLLFLNALVTSDGKDLSFGLADGIKTASQALNAAKNGLLVDAANPFNGTLVSAALIKRIGFPDGRFFIKGDETDYLTRARRAGAIVATVCSARFRHPAMPSQAKSILGCMRKVNVEPAWKWYYRMRNYTYMAKRDRGFLHAASTGTHHLVNGILGNEGGGSHCLSS